MNHAAAALQTVSGKPAQAAMPQVMLNWAAITEHRAFLISFARRKLLDPSLAEDLVHDVFEAVMTGRARFEGRSALRSWLVGVLKHKIVDLVRERSQHHSLDAMQDDEDGAALELESPEAGPEQRAEARQQLQLTMARIRALPDTLRRAVEMRLLHDRGTAEVCEVLQISEENLFVRLHRARKQLAN
jgi:RNA polymerase sigma-70 factor, ECF subfamily